jgi:hypothetical protein
MTTVTPTSSLETSRPSVPAADRSARLKVAGWLIAGGLVLAGIGQRIANGGR